MATSKNRSPSPNLARPNPNLRNSESNSSIRRSFSGNPFAKPSADSGRRKSLEKEGGISGRRRSVGKEGWISSQRYKEEKENESTKPEGRFRSPARSTKNFMSPTISAASKFTPSPRKRVLAEKNIDISLRTSISFSNNDNIQKHPESDLKLHMGGINQNKLAVNHVVLQDTCPPQVSLNSALKENACFEVHPSNSVLKNSVSDFQHVHENKLAVNHVVLENTCPLLHETPNSALPISNSVHIENTSVGVLSDELPLSSKTDDLSKTLSVDATDPSLPPYDPTNNYLSPRPLFLRYNPNPRVEVFLNKQVLDFEDSSLKSEISSDTTDITSSEKTKSDESSVNESDDDLSLVEMEQNTDPPLVSEPIHQETFVPTKIASKPPKFFTRTMSISLLLGFLIAFLCMSVTDSPIVGSPVFDPTSFYHSYDPSEAVEFAKANFDGLFRNFKQWSSNFVSYLSTMIHNFSKVGEELSLFPFSNTSLSHEDFLDVDNGFFNNHKLEENQEQNELENMRGEEAEPVIEENGEPGVEEMEQMTIQADLNDSSVDLETVQAEISDSFIIPSEVGLASQQSKDEPLHGYEDLKRIEDQMDLDLQTVAAASAAIEIEEFAKTDEFHGENDLISENSAEIVYQEVLVLDTQQLLHGESEENFSAGDVFLRHGVVSVVLPLAVLVILGSIFIIHMKMQSKAKTNSVADIVKPSSSFVVEKKIYEDEVNESSRSMKKNKNYKRESLASSDFSMGSPSPSYGSFTTYERIPKHNHGSGDEEIVTPVRRSSRIRSKVTSP